MSPFCFVQACNRKFYNIYFIILYKYKESYKSDSATNKDIYWVLTYNATCLITPQGQRQQLSGTPLHVQHLKKIVCQIYHKKSSCKKTNLMHNLFLAYFVNLYMFRAYLGPSSGSTTICIQHMVLIIHFRWLFVVLDGFQSTQDNRQSSEKNNKYQTYTYGCTSWWWA